MFLEEVLCARFGGLSVPSVYCEREPNDLMHLLNQLCSVQKHLTSGYSTIEGIAYDWIPSIGDPLVRRRLLTIKRLANSKRQDRAKKFAALTLSDPLPSELKKVIRRQKREVKRMEELSRKLDIAIEKSMKSDFGNLRQALFDPVWRRTLCLASPVFYHHLESVLVSFERTNNLTSGLRAKEIRTLWNYYSRSVFKTSPFGGFGYVLSPQADVSNKRLLCRTCFDPRVLDQVVSHLNVKGFQEWELAPVVRNLQTADEFLTLVFVCPPGSKGRYVNPVIGESNTLVRRLIDQYLLERCPCGTKKGLVRPQKDLPPRMVKKVVSGVFAAGGFVVCSGSSYLNSLSQISISVMLDKRESRRKILVRESDALKNCKSPVLENENTHSKEVRVYEDRLAPAPPQHLFSGFLRKSLTWKSLDEYLDQRVFRSHLFDLMVARFKSMYGKGGKCENALEFFLNLSVPVDRDPEVDAAINEDISFMAEGSQDRGAPINNYTSMAKSAWALVQPVGRDTHIALGKEVLVFNQGGTSTPGMLSRFSDLLGDCYQHSVEKEITKLWSSDLVFQISPYSSYDSSEYLCLNNLPTVGLPGNSRSPIDVDLRKMGLYHDVKTDTLVLVYQSNEVGLCYSGIRPRHSQDLFWRWIILLSNPWVTMSSVSMPNRYSSINPMEDYIHFPRRIVQNIIINRRSVFVPLSEFGMSEEPSFREFLIKFNRISQENNLPRESFVTRIGIPRGRGEKMEKPFFVSFHALMSIHALYKDVQSGGHVVGYDFSEAIPAPSDFHSVRWQDDSGTVSSGPRNMEFLASFRW